MANRYSGALNIYLFNGRTNESQVGERFRFGVQEMNVRIPFWRHKYISFQQLFSKWTSASMERTWRQMLNVKMNADGLARPYIHFWPSASISGNTDIPYLNWNLKFKFCAAIRDDFSWIQSHTTTTGFKKLWHVQISIMYRWSLALELKALFTDIE